MASQALVSLALFKRAHDRVAQAAQTGRIRRCQGLVVIAEFAVSKKRSRVGGRVETFGPAGAGP